MLSNDKLYGICQVVYSIERVMVCETMCGLLTCEFSIRLNLIANIEEILNYMYDPWNGYFRKLSFFSNTL